MESPSRGSRYPAPSRVAHKLGSDIAIISLPHRIRPRTSSNDERHLSKSQHLDTSPSLGGTTAPSSPTTLVGDYSSAGPHGHHQLVVVDAAPYLRRDVPRPVTPTMAKTACDDDSPKRVDASMSDHAFRKHHRGIGSIDSMLSSTTCVNTQSECSRPPSRVSRAAHVGGGMIPQHLLLEEATKYLAAAAARQDHHHHDNGGDGGIPEVVIIDPETPTTHHHASALSPPFTPIAIHRNFESDDVDHEETRIANEISSWVLRSLWGKEVDECVAPLLVSDCTQRYLQELWVAAAEGHLRQAAASPEQSGSSPNSSATLGGENGGDGAPLNGSGKGKRKADGGGDEADGYQRGGGDEGGNTATGTQPPNGRNNISSNFSCPYRKRNPLRFNVRNYYVCATHSFADMSQLKKHIRAHHPPVQRNAGPFSCPRCIQGFPTKNDLDDHLRRPDVCHITFDQGGADPEDGITQKIIVSLEARTLRLKIDNWTSLWRLLFPEDRTIPDPVFVPVMEVFDFVSESKKFLHTLRELLELQYRYVLEDADKSSDVERKIRQGLDKSTKSIYNWVETVILDWEQRFTGISLFPRAGSATQSVQSVGEESWTSSTSVLPPSPALTPTVVVGSEATIAAASRDESPESIGHASVNSRRTNPPPKRIRRSDAALKTTGIPIPIQKARTPQPPNSRTPNSSLRRPSGIPLLPTQAMTLPPNPPLQRPTFPQQWGEYPPVSSPYGAPPYSILTSSPGLHPQHLATAPAYPTNGVPQSPFLSQETHTAEQQHHQQQQMEHHLDQQQQQSIDQQQQQQQRHMDGVQHDPTPPPTGPADPRHSSTIRSSRFLSGTTPRTSLTSVWVRDTNSNANRDSAQTLVDAHPPGPCQNFYCPSCSKALPDGVGHPAQQQHHHPAAAVYGTGVVGPGGFAMHVVGEEHAYGNGGGEWGYGVGMGEGGVVGPGGGMFGGGGMQEGF